MVLDVEFLDNPEIIGYELLEYESGYSPSLAGRGSRSLARIKLHVGYSTCPTPHHAARVFSSFSTTFSEAMCIHFTIIGDFISDCRGLKPILSTVYYIGQGVTRNYGTTPLYT